MTKPKATGFKRIYNALGYSIQGIAAVYKSEAAFRQELLGCIVFIPIAFWLGETGLERTLLIFVLLLVLVIELINSAIEAVVDRFDEQHTFFGNAKDMGSAAVLLSLIMAGLVWLLILFD